MKKVSRVLWVLVISGLAVGALHSCSDNNEPEPVKEGIERAQIILTEVSGETVEAHGDHFHGLDGGTEGQPIVVDFNEAGVATQNGHLHLEAEAVYKVELKAWDFNGREVQKDYIANKATADQYKAFLIGGNFILNPNTTDESGAIFQPREATYGDGEAVNGKYEMTGILSYFSIGHQNEGATKEVTFVLRKLDTGVKATIERVDWNRSDYEATFAGENVLELSFEIHAEAGHSH